MEAELFPFVSIQRATGFCVYVRNLTDAEKFNTVVD